MSITAGGGTIVVEFRPSGIHGAPMIGAYLMRYFLNYKMPAWEKSYRFSNARAKISVEMDRGYLDTPLLKCLLC